MIMMVVGFSRRLGGLCGSGFLTAKEPGVVDIYSKLCVNCGAAEAEGGERWR
jgi:hypothetical protein